MKTNHDTNPQSKHLCRKRHSVLSVPVIRVAVFVHHKFGVHPVLGKYGTASVVVFSAAYMATNPVHWVPHFLWDGLWYGVHGIGAAPFAELIFKKLQGSSEKVEKIKIED